MTDEFPQLERSRYKLTLENVFLPQHLFIKSKIKYMLACLLPFRHKPAVAEI